LDFVIETAFCLREILAAEGHDCWPKTTGGKGLHIMVPIKPEVTWDAAHDYTRDICGTTCSDGTGSILIRARGVRSGTRGPGEQSVTAGP
jgi:bifunctional non-homologous end joining protein LigD